MKNTITKMMDGVELAKSGRARCRECGKQIGKGIPRGYRFDKRNQVGHINYCYKCSLRFIDLGMDILKDMKLNLKKLIKGNKDAIIKGDIINNLEDEDNG